MFHLDWSETLVTLVMSSAHRVGGLYQSTSMRTNRNKARIHRLWESVGLLAPAALVLFIVFVLNNQNSVLFFTALSCLAGQMQKNKRTPMRSHSTECA